MRSAWGTMGLAATLLTVATAKADFTGVVAEAGCGGLVTDNVARGGELYVMKTKNPGAGPDYQRDWLFDLAAKGGGATTSSVLAPSMWTVGDNFRRNTVPPDDVFSIVTYPNGWLAIDSGAVRGSGDTLGVVQLQHVGDSLPVGTAAGIGLKLSGDGSTYGASLNDSHGG